MKQRSYQTSITLMLFVWTLLVLQCTTPSSKTPYHAVSHELVVRLDIDRHVLEALDNLTLEYDDNLSEIAFFLNRGLDVKEITVGNQNLEFSLDSLYNLSDYVDLVDDKVKTLYENARLLRIDLPLPSKPNKIRIRYSGVLYDSLRSGSFSRMMVADQTTGLIGKEGVFLSGETHWYPNLPNMRSKLKLTAISPPGYPVLSEGKLVKQIDNSDSLVAVWEETRPLDTFYLCAGHYQVQRDSIDNVEVSTYFFKDSQHLSQTYLAACKQYIGMYNELLGQYPYAKFSVVENFFPTGYGMPSFTLLGSQVIRLPFMTQISLGHEICHNWWGNSVFVDMSKGNWCEGLTVYCADYYYKEQESAKAARDYRYQTLKDYSTYVSADSLDFPLKEFRERTTPASRTIGYGKSMMVFHQLRMMLGDEAFFDALRSVYNSKRSEYASWTDFQQAFEKQMEKPLDWYFKQWIERDGAPELMLSNVSVEEKDGQYLIDFDIEQCKMPFYRLEIPIKVITANETMSQIIDSKGKQTHVQLTTFSSPERVEVDPNFDVFRRLDWREIAPSLSIVFGGQNQVIVIPTSGDEKIRDTYKNFAESINRTGEAQMIRDTEFDAINFAASSMTFLGSVNENSGFEKFRDSLPSELQINEDSFTLFEINYDKSDHCLVVAFRNPFNEEKGVVWIWGLSQKAVIPVARKILHYGKYGYLVFDNGVNIAKGDWEVTASPLTYIF